MAELLSTICAKVVSMVRKRKRRNRSEGNNVDSRALKNSGLRKARWAEGWLKEGQQDPANADWTALSADEAILREWKSRRRWQRPTALLRRPRSAEAADVFDLNPKTGFPLRLHKDLTKAKSSLLTQAQTGAIGLNAFLYRRRIPGVTPDWRH